MGERVLTVLGNKASRPIEDFMIGIVGTEFYVGPNATGAGDDGRSGRSKETSLATTEAAIALATASKNDIVYLLPGHAETIATAGAISLDKIGLRVIGLGTGALRPTFTFSAVDSTLTVTAASCVLENVIVKPSIDAVVSPIVVSAADCKVDVEIQDATALIECETGILTTAAAERLDIKLKYRGFIAGDACVTPIKLVGVDTGRVDVDFYGKASTAVVEFATTNCHDIVVTGKFYNESAALTKNVVDSQTSTWSVVGYDSKGDAAFSGGDNKAVAYADIETIASDLVVTNAIVDTIASDIVVLDPIIDTIASDLIVLDTVADTIASDLILVDTVVDTVASDLVVMDALIDAEVIKTATIVSDLVVMDAILDTVASDIVVLDPIIDTIASDLIVADGVIDKVYSDTTIILSDLTVFFTKYASDVP